VKGTTLRSGSKTYLELRWKIELLFVEKTSPGLLKGQHKTVIETKGAQIKANLSEPPLVTSNNHRKKG
jgi:hypothetical protein